jgi:hypothetical protein
MRCLRTRSGAVRDLPGICRGGGFPSGRARPPSFQVLRPPHAPPAPTSASKCHLEPVYRGLLIAHPYRAPVRPNPPALTTKCIHAARLFGAVCQHPPAGSARALSSVIDDSDPLRRPTTTLLVLQCCFRAATPPCPQFTPPLCLPPYATPVAAAAAYLGLCPLLLPSIPFQFVAVPSHCISAAAQRQASPVTGV